MLSSLSVRIFFLPRKLAQISYDMSEEEWDEGCSSRSPTRVPDGLDLERIGSGGSTLPDRQAFAATCFGNQQAHTPGSSCRTKWPVQATVVRQHKQCAIPRAGADPNV